MNFDRPVLKGWHERVAQYVSEIERLKSAPNSGWIEMRIKFYQRAIDSEIERASK